MPDSPTLPLLDAALRGALIATLLLLALAMLRAWPRATVTRIGAALALGLSVQAFSSAPAFEALVPRLWQAPLVAVSVGNAVLFWLFARALFDDDFVPRRWHGALWLAVAALSGLNCAVMAPLAPGWPPAALSLLLQRWIPLVFAMLATLAASLHWRADLVERRRRLRAFIVVAGSAYTLAMVAARLAAPGGQLSGRTASLDTAALLAIAAVLAWQLMRAGSSDLFVAAPSAEPATALPPAPAPAVLPQPDPAEERLAGELQRYMTEQRAYQIEDLGIAALAARLDAPEYRLRRVINQRLGHRNFNAYINGFRLAEAKAALADPARRELPVLTIALEAGFQSIGPFNRAFKVDTGLTPSEFRRQKLADS